MWAWLVVLLVGCVSPVMSFGGGKTRQQVVHEQAARITPGSLRAVDAWKGEVRTVRVRVYADDEYRAQHVKWQQTFQAQLDDANDIFSSQFGVRFVAELQSWRYRADGVRLEDTLRALIDADPGKDVFVVIGLTSSLTLVTSSFDQLGIATSPGRHLVMRGYSDLKEREALESAFEDLRKDEREVMYEARRRHKTIAVLLHELGHVFGAQHAADTSSLMTSTYSVDAVSFDASSRERILATLDQRLGRPTRRTNEPSGPSGPTSEPTTPATVESPPDEVKPLKPLPTDPKDKTPILEVVVDAKGFRKVAGKLVADATLDGLFLLHFGDDPRTRVFVRSIDASAGAVNDVVARAKQAGLQRVTVVHE